MNPGLSVHGVLILIVVTFFVAYAAWRIGEREGDERGILGFLIAGITFLGGLLWMLGV